MSAYTCLSKDVEVRCYRVYPWVSRLEGRGIAAPRSPLKPENPWGGYGGGGFGLDAAVVSIFQSCGMGSCAA